MKRKRSSQYTSSRSFIIWWFFFFIMAPFYVSAFLGKQLRPLYRRMLRKFTALAGACESWPRLLFGYLLNPSVFKHIEPRELQGLQSMIHFLRGTNLCMLKQAPFKKCHWQTWLANSMGLRSSYWKGKLYTDLCRKFGAVPKGAQTSQWVT